MNTSFGVIGDALVATMQVRPVIIDEIQSLQDQDRFRFLRKMKENVRSGKGKDFMIRGDGMLCKNFICVPKIGDIRMRLMEEAYCASYSLHPGSTKMYRDIRRRWRACDEEGDSRICGQVSYLSTDQGRTSSSSREVAITFHTSMEVG